MQSSASQARAQSMVLQDALSQFSGCEQCVEITASNPLVQVRVIGLQYGSWGITNYGVKPVKVDALDFWPARLKKLRELILDEQPLARSRAMPTAFVTFKYVSLTCHCMGFCDCKCGFS